MLTLTGQREIGGCNVYRDDVDPLAWYVLPQSPAIALDEQGRPVFSLVWYRRDLAKLTEEERQTKLGGGILSCSVELAVSADKDKLIRKAIAADPTLHNRLAREVPARGPDLRRWWLQEISSDENKLAEALKISAVPVREGTVSLAVLAETTGEGGGLGEMVSSLVGVGRVSMTGKQRASFMAKLTQDGAVLLWKMVEKNLAAIRVAYDLKVNHRLDAVRMIVWCNAQKSYQALQEQWQDITDDARWSTTHSGNTTRHTFSRDQSINARDRMEETLRASESAGVEIIPEAGADTLKPETINELIQSGNEMIKDFIASTFLQFEVGEQTTFDPEPQLETGLPEVDGKKYGHHGIHQYKLKTWSESMSADLRFDFKQQAVLEQVFAPNDNLSNVLGGRKVDEFRREIDLANVAFYDYLDVQVTCTADFDEDPVDLVKAHLAYHGRGSTGEIHEVKDFAFQKGTAPQRFSTFVGAPDQRAYDYEIEVFYKGSAQTYTLKGRSEDTIFVLDTDRLGVLRVEAQLGIVDWDRMRQAVVKLWYGSGSQRKESEFVLDAQRQSKKWTDVIGRPVTEPVHYQVTWVDKNNQRIETDEQTSRAPIMILNSPIGPEHEVAFVPVGSFGPDGMLLKILATAVYRDDANDYTVDETLEFAKEGETKFFKAPLVDANLRKIRYRETVIYTGGVAREEPWKTTDSTIVVIGDPASMRVQVLPYLLKNPPGMWAFGTLQLLFDDPQTGIRAEKTFEISDFGKPQTWRFRLGAPERHTYKYQLTLFKPDGTKVELPVAEESKEVLVLIPPAATPPAPPAPPAPPTPPIP